ncbi:hypothetical protein AC579_4246 [Pseudocercospora musae]|uniref:F-box domain-containing protein n=1 Tax=Pseudocercospora musae TaxID=113226 RepID=A0A139IFE0_9PEZI|nr:hypothetical protein AC579_4246 [Pseudocercospora musae]
MATAVATQTETQQPEAQKVQRADRTEIEQKSKASFNALSEELKGEIVERVIRPSDLKNVCLVSKQLHSLAVRPLYRNVALDLGSNNDNRLTAFVNPRNIGLKHIRQLRLYLAEVRDKCNQEQQAQFATRMILEFLPEDTLEEFSYYRNSWCPWRPFSTDNLLLLYKRQRKMKWLEVMDLDRDVLPELKKNAKLQQNMFTHARKLALYPENRETLNLSGYFVEKCKDQLEELIVHCHWHDLNSGSNIESRELNDSATEPGLLLRSIFGHLLPFEQCTPFKSLRSLRLHKVGLRHCADTWCKFINFHDLEYLRLYHCTGADTLLGQLSKSSHLPKNLKVLEFQHRDNSDNEALLALDAFLCLVSGLRDLVIDLANVKSMPAAAGVVRHGKTLELLNVHCAQDSHATSLASDCDNEELVWDTEDFEKICKASKDIEQLSCAWPHTSLIRSPSEEWKAFESSCGHLKNMVTLHITTWPSNKPSTQLLPRMVYENLLQDLAQRGFDMAAGTKTFPTSAVADDSDDEDEASAANTNTSEDNTDSQPAKLRLIAFGTSDKIYEREDSKNQTIFLRSSCVDADGKIKPYAAPIGWCARQFVEPRSEVLDFVLHRSGDRDNHPPVSDYHEGRVRSGWGGVGDEDE